MSTESLREIFEGRTIQGRYRLVRLLAEGGFGAVFHAEHVLFGEPVREVAIKISKASGLTKETAKTVFGESILLAQIYDRIPDAAAREYIVPVFDMGILDDFDSRGFVVMALISDRGAAAAPRTLANEIKAYPRGLPAQAAARFFAEICEGMAAVHRLNVIHRDLKPENILLTPAGRIRIVDFGLAAGLDKAGMAEGRGGTHAYMAPETAEEGQSNARSDVYSLGVIFFEMLTGQHPFAEIQPPSSVAEEAREAWIVGHKRDQVFHRANEIRSSRRGSIGW